MRADGSNPDASQSAGPIVPQHRGSILTLGGGPSSGGGLSSLLNLHARNSSAEASGAVAGASDGTSGLAHKSSFVQPLSVSSILTPQHPPSAAGLSSVTAGDGASPSLHRDGSLGGGSGADAVYPLASSGSVASTKPSASDDKATWRNGPRLSISAAGSQGMVGPSPANAAVAALLGPQSTRAASASVSARFSSHTHAPLQPGALGALTGSVNGRTGTNGSLGPPAFSQHCDQCGFTLHIRFCQGCGAKLHAPPHNAHAATQHHHHFPTLPAHSSVAQSSAQPMSASANAAPLGHLPHHASAPSSATLPANFVMPSGPTTAVTSASAVHDFACAACHVAVFPGGSFPSFCPACGGEYGAPHAAGPSNGATNTPSLSASVPLAVGAWNRGGRAGTTVNANPAVVPSAAGGQAVVEGYLKKVGARLKTIMSRWYVLRDNYLYCYMKPGDLQPAHVFFLEGCFVEPVNHEEQNRKLRYGIEIIMRDNLATQEEPRKSRILYAHSSESRAQWINSIRMHANVHSIEEYYRLGPELGVGRFSSVREGVSLRSGKRYAVKVIEKSAVREAEREALRTEVALLKLVHHPSIIRLKAVFESRRQMFLVMSYVEGGDLFDRLLKRKRFPEHVARLITQRDHGGCGLPACAWNRAPRPETGKRHVG